MDARPEMHLLERKLMKAPTFLLDARSRSAVETAIRNVCSFREFTLRAIHVRTNHAHTVVSAARSPVLVMNSFKSYATRKLRSDGLIAAGTKVWSRHGSTRYLWTERHIETAVEYVLLGQGDDLPTFE
jgi:REP element-mobilizing transposase RayT